MVQFDFGENWQEFARYALTPERVQAAKVEFARLMSGIPLAGRSFLDIGFGQGLSLLLSVEQGARGVGCDVNEKCKVALAHTSRFFPALQGARITIVVGSILQKDTVERLGASSPQGAGYDIVHSWGVLHHTGDMSAAIRNTVRLVRPGGYLVIAIYNRHWSSRLWLFIKWLYVRSPQFLRGAMIWLLYPIIWSASLLVTGENPMHQRRGMDFYHNVVDWVGGYPYEFASPEEIVNMVEALGFTCIRFVRAMVPTGCNEFVFGRHSDSRN